MLSDLINKSKYVRMQKYAALVREIDTGHVKAGAGKGKGGGLMGLFFGTMRKVAPRSGIPMRNATGTFLHNGKPLTGKGDFTHNGNKIFYTADNRGVKFFSDSDRTKRLSNKDLTALKQELTQNWYRAGTRRAGELGHGMGYRQGHARGAARGTIGTAGTLGAGYLGLSYLGGDKEYTPNTPGTGGGTKEEGKDSLLPWLIGIPLVAGAGYGAYKLLSKKKKKDEDDSSED